MTKEARIYNGEKTVSSASGVGKAGQLHVNQLNYNTLTHTIYKNKLKSFPGGAVVESLPAMQGTRVRALVWEDPTCCGATRPVSHNY